MNLSNKPAADCTTPPNKLLETNINSKTQPQSSDTKPEQLKINANRNVISPDTLNNNNLTSPPIDDKVKIPASDVSKKSVTPIKIYLCKYCDREFEENISCKT